MKCSLIILGVIGWLCLPILCHSVYAGMKLYLADKAQELIQAGKATHQDLDNPLWSRPIKSLGTIAETYRSRYFFPFVGVWILLGFGLAGSLLYRKGHPTRACS